MHAAHGEPMNERILGRVIMGAIAATLPMGGGITACGGGSGGSDGGDATDNDAPCFCCDLPPPQMYTVTYDVCPPLDMDAASDAADAGEDGGGGVCYTNCNQACEMTEPPHQTGVGSCIGDIDGGDVGVRVAQCEILQLCGRRMDGLDEPATIDMIAHAAWLEAASIHAFRRLASELEAHGAPADLVQRAHACARATRPVMRG